ncbi:GNAT family N-acetyltransferase [Alteribacillus persepolensis]|nr:GNAT family N-acetyltransferase [Alteribacillus persepolensis]
MRQALEHRSVLPDGRFVTFREFSMEEDVERLYTWMHKEHVIPFWQLNLPWDTFLSHVDRSINDAHQRMWIGVIENVPMSYWETYEAKDDIIGRYYDAAAHDKGIHLLFGPESYLGRGLAEPMVEQMLNVIYQDEKVEKVLAEPDIENKKMIHVFLKCGFQPVKPIDLPDKTGLLMVHYHRRGGENIDS